MNAIKHKIVITGGSGRFGSILKNNIKSKKIFFPKKKYLNILSTNSIKKYLTKLKPKIQHACNTQNRWSFTASFCSFRHNTTKANNTRAEIKKRQNTATLGDIPLCCCKLIAIHVVPQITTTKAYNSAFILFQPNSNHSRYCAWLGLSFLTPSCGHYHELVVFY